MPEPLVVQIMRENREALLRRDAAQQRTMAMRWRQVEQHLQEQVTLFAEKVVKDGLTPGQIQDARFQQERFASLLMQTRLELDKYTDFAVPQIANQQRALAGRGIVQAAAAINAVAQEYGRTRIAFDVLPIGAVENLVGLAGDGSPLRTVLERAYGAGAQGMLDQLVTGVAAGYNPRVIARRMVRNGLSLTLNQVMTTARTEPLRVFRESSRQQYTASGVVENYRRLATRDSRTCMGCLVADGEVYELGESMRTHPQCRCTQIPSVTGFNPVQWQKGPDWFKVQPENVQRKMMGPGVFDLWKNKKISLDQTVSVRKNDTWGDSVEPTSLKRLLGGKVKSFVVAKLPDEPAKPPKAADAPKVNVQTAKQARTKLKRLETKREKEIAKTNKDLDKIQVKMKDLFDERNKLFGLAKKAKGVDKLSIEERIAEVTQKLTDAENESITVGRQIAAALNNYSVDTLNAVRVDDPSDYKVRATVKDPNVLSNWNYGMEQFNKLVSRDVVMDISQVKYIKLPDGGRAFARSWDEEIHVTGDQETRVIVHELGHILEGRAGILDKVLAFYDRRTIGYQLEKMSDVTGDKRYADTEITRKDKFIDAYMGKDYKRNATEVVSMGIEYLYAEPGKFAKEDPEMFDFIYDLLRGR